MRQREKKYRAWNEGYGWSYFVIGQQWSEVTAAVYSKLCLDGVTFYECLGEKDRNDEEVYEGDVVVSQTYERSETIVTYEYGEWCPVEYYMGWENFVIVGNVVENPEYFNLDS